MYLHIENINMISYQTAKGSFTLYLRYSFTPDKFRNNFMGLSCQMGGIHIYTCFLLKVMHLCFYLNSVNFFVQYMTIDN